MKKIFVPNYSFESPFGKFTVHAEVEIDRPEYVRYLGGEDLKSLTHTVLNEESCLKQAATWFYLNVYKAIIRRKAELTPEQVQLIRIILNINFAKFASIIGVTRGSLTNFLKGRRKMQRSAQILVMERLGFELLMPGSALILIDRTKNIPLRYDLQELIGTFKAALHPK